MVASEVTRAFELLASVLEAGGHDIPDLVICGGSALQIIGLLDRATRDVDVLALLYINENGSKRFGTRLIVHFIDRYDQIMLKTYAIINGGDMRHLSDLKALVPTDEEMLDAAKWCLRQDASDAFPTLVQTFLEKAGYGSIVQQLDPTNPK